MKNKDIALAKTDVPDVKRLESLKVRAQDFSMKAVLILLPEIASHYLGIEDRQMLLFKNDKQSKTPDITDEDLQSSCNEYLQRLIPYTHHNICYRLQLIVGQLTQDNFPEIYPKPPEESKGNNDSTPVVEAQVEVEKPIRQVAPSSS